jgi:hypothetical protein
MIGLLMNESAYITLDNIEFNYPYKGFCSIVCAIIDMATEHYVVDNNFNIEINEPQTLRLFDNISPKTNKTYDAGSWWLERYFSNQIYQPEYNAHTPANIDNLKIKNKVYNQILKIKDEYLEAFEIKRKKYNIDENTLGVQIRGTDKKNELPEIKIENICSMIDSSIQEKIFVATDDKSYLDALIERYGNRIVYDSSVSISNNKEPLHLTTCDRPKINEEVLSNVYLLSCCGSFLYSFSNVSLLALIMGVYNFDTFYHLN